MNDLKNGEVLDAEHLEKNYMLKARVKETIKTKIQENVDECYMLGTLKRNKEVFDKHMEVDLKLKELLRDLGLGL